LTSGVPLQKCDIIEAKAFDVTLDWDCIGSGVIDDDAAGAVAVCDSAATSTALMTASMAESNR
jgi:hypothetical protein